jgi:beta-glucosidase-like glycosyl hydrolase
MQKKLSTQSELSMRQKLYQLIINRIDGDKLSNPEYVQKQFDLVAKGIGGFIFFGGSRDRVSSFIAQIQAAAQIPLFLASDIERGVAQQIQGTTPFPSQMAVAAAIDMKRHEDRHTLANALCAFAAEVNDIGLNMALLPVLDVNSNPDNPIICTRALSDDPPTVATLGAYYIKTLQSCGILTCAKHFPGHGDTSIDSHIELPHIEKSRSAFMQCDVFPYRSAIEVGVPCIMVGHLQVPALDDTRPASISQKIITDLLRKELGFQGLILTDALTMDALSGISHLPVECLKAGADILLHPMDADATVAELQAALDNGTIAPHLVEEALARILRTKESLLQKPIKTSGHLGSLAARLAGRAITLLDQTSEVLPLEDPEHTYLVLCGDISKYDTSPIGSAFPQTLTLHDAVNEPHHTVLFAIFTHVAAWHGSADLPAEEILQIQNAIKKTQHSIVISFGSPYVLRHFGRANARIAAYDASRYAQGAVIGCLGGALRFSGKLPVRIPKAFINAR